MIWFLLYLLYHHDLLTFQKFCVCIDGKFLVPEEFMTIAGETVISNGPKFCTKRDLLIDK